MTVAVANVDLTNTFDQWRVRTNQIAAALSTLVLTVNSNSAIGNAGIVGIFTANAIATDAIGGGTTGAPADLTVTTNTSFQEATTFEKSVTFSSDPASVTDLGTQTNIRLAGANATHRYVVGYPNNSVAFETLINVLHVGELADVNVDSYGVSNTVANGAITANGSIIQFDTVLGEWRIGRNPWTVGANGNVSLGGTVDSNKLNITGNAKVTGNVVVGTNLLITDTALLRVGINKAAPQATLHVGGNIYLDGDYTTFYTSDARLKKDVFTIVPETGRNKLRSLRPVVFMWDQKAVEKNELVGPKPEGMDLGFIAQEVQRVVPEAVVTRDNGTFAMSYERLVPLLVAAIQDLQQRLDKVENGNR